MRGAGALALAGMLPVRAWAQDERGSGLTPAQALQKLREGNASFFAGRPQVYRNTAAYRREIANLPKQTPFATIVCCSDSRAGPELIFHTGLMELFVVRNAGNTLANPQALGSVEYSVADFGVPLIVVLGHTNCGAAKEAVNIVQNDKPFPPTLEAMLLPLVPAALATREPAATPARDAADEDWIDRAAKENVRRITAVLRSPTQPILYPPQLTGQLKVVGATYNLKTGMVDFFDLGGM